MSSRILLPASGLLIGTLVLAGCTAVAETTSTGASTTASTATGDSTAEAVMAANDDATTVNDDEWTLDSAVAIALTGSTASAAGDGVAIDGSTVTITAAGTYVVSGSLTGRLVVDAPDDALVAIVLDDASITADDGAAIAVVAADDVVISLAAGSSNEIVASTAADSEQNAAIWADVDLTVPGTGELTVTDTGNDGIATSDDLVVLSGELRITAADDGLVGKDSLTVEGGTLTIDAGADALRSDQDDADTRGWVLVSGGTLTLTAGDDGIDALSDAVLTGGSLTIAAGGDGIHSESVLVVEGATIDIVEAGEGLESFVVAINAGSITVVASDDGVNAAGGESTGEADGGQLFVMTGGTLDVVARGDALDSNGSIEVSGGVLTASGPTSGGEGAVDANGTITLTGGTVIAAGTAGAVADASTLGWFALTLDAAIPAGSTLEVLDDSGAVVASLTLAQQAGALLVADAAIVDGESYTVQVDGAAVATAAGGTGSAGGMGGGPGAPGGFGGGPGGRP